MNPKQRVDFFNKQVDLSEINENAGLKNANLTSIKLATTAILLAQSSGIGLYLASTTALGFATHAVGISLPFAAYTGLTSTIAFVIGPVGWLTVGLWGGWLVTGPEWKKLISAIIYIASVNSQIKIQVVDTSIK